MDKRNVDIAKEKGHGALKPKRVAISLQNVKIVSKEKEDGD